MGKAFGNDNTLACTLKRIITDCFGGTKPFLNIAGFDPRGIFCSPDACITIGLQFHRDLQAVTLHFARAGLSLLNFACNARQKLKMVANFVRNDISLCEIARCAEPL